MRILQIARAGADATAVALLKGLVAAGHHFGYRLPELFGGEQRTRGSLMLRAVLGITPDVPGGTLRLRPLRPFPFHRLSVQGIVLPRGVLSVVVEGDELTVTEAPDGLTVLTEGRQWG